MTKLALASFCFPFILAFYGLELQQPEIFKTVCEGNFGKLDTLLTVPSNIKVKSQRGTTLLHVAVGCGQRKMVEYLIDKGIDINKEDNYGKTPLAIAIELRYEGIERLLRKKNAKVEP